MAEFERHHFISDEALMAPLIMTERLQKMLATIKEVRKTSIESGLSSSKSSGGGSNDSTSTKKLKEETVKLTTAQQELVKVQNKLAVAVAKDNDEYRKQEQALVRLNVEIKNKSALGSKEALQVNKMNSSLKEIEAALNANRVAYSNLRSEEERNSQTGVTLLKTIQDQKKATGELREEMGQFSGNVGNYTGSIIKAHNAIKEQEDETKKLIVAQKGLDKGTTEGKKSYDQLNVAIQNNITQINVYRKEAGMAATSTGELNKQLKDTDKSSGGLGDALGRISPGLKAAYDGAISFGKALWALAANPVGLVIAAIALAVAGLARYFTSSTEGQDKWNKILAVGSAILDGFLDILEKVGKALVTAVSEPQKAWQGFIETMQPILKIFQKIGSGLADIFTFNFKAGAAKITDALTSIADLAISVWNGAKKASQEFYEAAEAKAQKLLAIEKRYAQFRKDAIQDIIDDSITELSVSKDMQKVHDKLRNSEEDRLAALRDANAQLKAQSEGDVALANTELKIMEDKLGVMKDGFTIDKLTYDEAKALADLRVKVNNTAQAYNDGQRKRLAEEFTLVSEISKRRLDQINSEKAAVENLNKWRLEDAIATNQKVIDNEFSTIGESANAIGEINNLRVKLAEDASAKELEIAFNTAKERVALDSGQLKQIYQNKSLSFEEQLALEDKFRSDVAAKDQAYITTATQIESDKFAEIDRINKQSADAATENVFTILERDAKNMGNTLDTATNRALINLEKQFEDNEVSLADYNTRKLEIQKEGEAASIASQVEYLKKQAALLLVGSEQRTEIENQISELELSAQANKNALKLEAEQQIQAGLNELATTGVDLAMETIGNFFAAEDEARQARLEKIQETMNAELLAAGDNEAAKVAIKNKAEAEQQKIRLQQAAAARKQAIFEKTVAVISIAINTAKGIGQALGTYPPPASFVLAAITGVLGALQIAAVLSKPIPSYAVGTENHPGGLAQVGEEGPERVTLPGGKSFLTPGGPTLMDLPAGSKVDTHRDTMNQLALRSLPHTDRQGTKGDIEGFDKLGKKLDSLESTVRNKKEQHWNISKSGMQAMVKNAETRSYFMDQLYR